MPKLSCKGWPAGASTVAQARPGATLLAACTTLAILLHERSKRSLKPRQWEGGVGQGVSEDDLVTVDRALMNRFRPPLLAFFERRMGDRIVAEDLTQEAFLRLFVAARRDEIQNVGALLFKIASNLLRDEYRKAAREPRFQAVEPRQDDARRSHRELVEPRHPERLLIGRQRIDALVRALDELNERTRSIYILFRLEKMKQADIAAVFGVSKSTIEKEIAKASLHLAKRLRAQW
jgi:RNA polymerase sigma-70 factor (ECF subfamily)